MISKIYTLFYAILIYTIYKEVKIYGKKEEKLTYKIEQ